MRLSGQLAGILLGPHPRVAQPQQGLARLFAGLMLVHVALAVPFILLTNLIYVLQAGQTIWDDKDFLVVAGGLAAIVCCYALLRAGLYIVSVVSYIAVCTIVPLTAPFVNDPDAEIGLLALALIPILLCALLYSTRTVLLLIVLMAVVGAAQLLQAPLSLTERGTGSSILIAVIVMGVLIVYFRQYFSSIEAQRSALLQSSEVARRESDLRYAQLFDQAHYGIAIVQEGCIRYCNRAFELVVHADPNTVVNAKLLWYIVGTDRDKVETILRQQPCEQPQPVVLEVTGQDAAGNPLNLELSLGNTTMAGQPALLLFAREISERTRLQDALIQGERKYRSLFDLVTDGIFIANSAGRIVEANGYACSQLGYSREELLQLQLWQISTRPPDTITAGLQRMAEGQTTTYETQHRRKDGTVLDVELSLSRVVYIGQPAFLGIARDLSERKQAAQALRTSEERYRLLAETAQEYIVVFDLQGRIVYANRAALAASGSTPEDVPRLTMADLAPPEELPRWQQLLQRRQDGWTEVDSFKTEFKTRFGQRVPVEVNNVPIVQNGRITGILNIARDISERLQIERAEAQLRQAQKLEALGTLAGGVAHDFNNILFAISANAEMALDQVDANSEQFENLSQILQASQRATALVKQILAFSRRSGSVRLALNLGTIVKEVVKLLRPALPTTIEMRVQTTGSTAVIEADAVEMHQVLLNLCTNAAQAMQDQPGVLEINVSDVVIDQETALAQPDLQPGMYVRVTVSDTGQGMEREVQQRIFEPYFTTKAAGQGTGLGLAVVHGIVTKMDGLIRLYSEPGLGTTFHLYFPAAAEAVALEGQQDSDQLPRGDARLLLVDDERAIVMVLKQMLTDLGYTVTAFTSSTEALEAFRRKPGAFDLVLTDMTMPKLTGAELARQMLELRPELPVILCTGFSHVISADIAREMGIAAYLMKPASRAELARVVYEQLNSRLQRTP